MVTGTADGNIHINEIDQGKILYSFGAMLKGEVRCLKLSPDASKYIKYYIQGFV